MKNNKKYIQPKITSVYLDPEQALLQVCRAGGIYLQALNTTTMWCSTAAGKGPKCILTPKGGDGNSLQLGFTSAVCDRSQSLPS
ncbi:MAG: hypothetical protein PHQ52_04810 [Candidatus Omnitrophica bacterium]|nr:hypothetical protein [Candidatus Omnitrophota bacterium]